MNDRNSLYNEAIKCLENPSQTNIQIIKHHIFKLKINDEFIIKTQEQINDLVAFINCNHDKV